MRFLEPLLVSILNRLTSPPKRKPTPEGLLLGLSRSPSGQPHTVVIPEVRRFEHAFVLGKTGMGKTHLLQHLAWQHMQRSEGFLFFDYHGDSIERLLRLAARAPDAESRLVLVDPTDRLTSPGINPLEIPEDSGDSAFGRTSELSTILRSRWGVDAFGPRTEELLRNSLYTLAVHGLTLAELSKLLTDGPFRIALTTRLPSPDIAAYWRDRFEPLSDAMKAQFREPLLNRTTGFLTEPSMRHVLGQRESTIRFGRAMAEGQWVLVNLSKGILREHAHTLGNLICAKLLFDVFGRISLPPQNRRLFSILCDEVQNLGENDLVTLLTEGRKFGVSLITANQFYDQLPKALRGALLASSTQIFFRLSASDAKSLAPELSLTDRRFASELTNLERGKALGRVGSEPPQTIRVPGLPESTDRQRARAHALRSLSLSRYARPRANIEAEILERTAPQESYPHEHPDEPPISEDEGQAEW
jgi:Type IV secretion-system coupling protein DNA-binding domain